MTSVWRGVMEVLRARRRERREKHRSIDRRKGRILRLRKAG